MRVPLGAQRFPIDARIAGQRMRKDGCVRVTFRMLPEMRVLVTEQQRYASGDPKFDVFDVNTLANQVETNWEPKLPSSYFEQVAGDVPDVIYLQVPLSDIHL